ncbi:MULTISPECIES: class I SAM-dependent methyltransferase [Candidatus Ichthyocystis]|uniref:class I SAM-dependent methyltransferase n=1 Tax=Candidatus Ichthyocystis TaxID=2929841 RepID=UPI000B85E563|nr:MULTISPECIES: methyltransferase domain-containing protein [Ichthyocystis]
MIDDIKTREYELLSIKSLQEWEQLEIDKIIYHIFGDSALQMGMSQNARLLQESRILHKISLDTQGEPSILAEFDYIPLMSDSIDLVILPHILESSSSPKGILQEAQRILRPGGHIVIASFNPWSFWGIHQLIHKSTNRGLPLSRVKDWMKELGLHITQGSFGCYRPLTYNKVWYNRLEFLERVGNRWWPFTGSIYIVCAIKEVAGMTFVMKNAWKKNRPQGRGLDTICRHEIDG